MDLTLSVDKVALVYTPRKKMDDVVINLEVLVDRMLSAGFRLDKEWCIFSPFKYRYNYTFIGSDDREGAIYIGFGINSKNGKMANAIKIEFNPNKVSKAPVPFENFIEPLGYKFSEIQSIDFALDIPIPLGLFRIVPANGTSQIMTYGTQDNLTLYLNPSADDHRVKVYDKGRERGTDQILTRCEVTLKRFTDRLDQIGDLRYLFSQISFESGLPSYDPLTFAIQISDQVTRSQIFNLIPRKNTKADIRKSLRTEARRVDSILPDQADLERFIQSVNRDFSITSFLGSVNPHILNYRKGGDRL